MILHVGSTNIFYNAMILHVGSTNIFYNAMILHVGYTNIFYNIAILRVGSIFRLHWVIPRCALNDNNTTQDK
jgi:hypothetical protein